MELFIFSEFQKIMGEQHENVYSLLMVKKYYKEKPKMKLILLLEVAKVTL